MGAKGSRSKSVDITSPPADDAASPEKKLSENGGTEIAENSHPKEGAEIKTENGEGVGVGDGAVANDIEGGSGDDSAKKETVEDEVKVVVSEKGDSGDNQETKDENVLESNEVKESEEKPAEGEEETEAKEEVEDADKKDTDKEDGKKDKKKDKKEKDKKEKEKKDKKKEEEKKKEEKKAKKEGEVKKEKKKRSFSFLSRNKDKKKEEDSQEVTVNGEVDHEDESKQAVTEAPVVAEGLETVKEVASPVVEQAPVASPEPTDIASPPTETIPPIDAEEIEEPKQIKEQAADPEPAIIPPTGAKIITPTNGLIPTRISWEHGAKEVKIMGSFSEWKDNIQLNASDDVFDVTVDLKQGEHHIKFCVDGNWTVNNNLKVVEVEGQGQVNLLVVGAPASEE